MVELLTAWAAVSAIVALALNRQAISDRTKNFVRSRLQMDADSRLQEIRKLCDEAMSDLDTGADFYDEPVVPVRRLRPFLEAT